MNKYEVTFTTGVAVIEADGFELGAEWVVFHAEDSGVAAYAAERVLEIKKVKE